MAERLTFDVFGKRIMVERAADGWRLWGPGPDGKRSPVEIEIPAFVTEDELLQYLDDIYHELATPANPCVRRVPGDGERRVSENAPRPEGRVAERWRAAVGSATATPHGLEEAGVSRETAMAARKPASSKASGAVTVDDFMRALDHPLKAEIDAVRKIIVAASPHIEEGIKWNAPSFRAGEWFATINLRSKGFVHVILHLGAKGGRDATARMRAADPAGLLEWLAKDRAAIKLRDRNDITAQREPLIRIVRHWIEPR